MSTTTGCFVSLLNSVELASLSDNTDLANSITAHCMPRHIPKNGFLFSRAKRQAAIFPSIPRSPKPPGTRIPSALFSNSSACLCFSGCAITADSSSSSELTVTLTMRLLHARAACSRALYTDA
ncbi:hypothetical protein M513_03135 [Trichuris suis]|uniref:Uncharacterized protein n=1 Tax=Trichuris suis TaxID=68888 RepID=A0A085MFL5_9BILA|nr:hypothetical protein M513_03135 [Trichuris suis]